MAYDVLRGHDVGRSWSRGDFPTGLALEAARRKIPWAPILIGLGAGAGLLFLLSSRKAPTVAPMALGHQRRRHVTRPTRVIPSQTMHDLVYGKKVK